MLECKFLDILDSDSLATLHMEKNYKPGFKDIKHCYSYYDELTLVLVYEVPKFHHICCILPMHWSFLSSFERRHHMNISVRVSYQKWFSCSY